MFAEKTKAAPADLPTDCFDFSGQWVCEHDEGFQSGFFHTYDHLNFGDAPRKMHVFLPRDYHRVNDRYPVVYFNDGQSVFFPNNPGRKTWRVAETLETLYATGALRDIIVVAVYPLDRNREYTHARPPRPRPGDTCCGVEDYADYLATKVKPYIDRSYRTLRSASQTAIIGASHGGLAAFYVAMRHFHQFGMAGALSPSFWVGVPVRGKSQQDDSLESSALIKKFAPILSSPGCRPKIWLDWGLVREGGEHNSWVEHHATLRGREMLALLTAKFSFGLGLELSYQEDPEGGHTEESWARRLPHVLTWFFPSKL